jgi:hypothetical protein
MKNKIEELEQILDEAIMDKLKRRLPMREEDVEQMQDVLRIRRIWQRSTMVIFRAKNSAIVTD